MIYQIVILIGLLVFGLVVTNRKYVWRCDQCGTIVKAKTVELRDRGIRLHDKFLNCSGGKDV